MLKRKLQSNIQIIRETKQFIIENDCPFMSFDVSNLNVIDAVNSVILCSTYHYAKYPQGKVEWVVNSPEVERLVKPFSLGNVKFSIR